VRAFLHGGQHLVSGAIVYFHWEIEEMAGQIETVFAWTLVAGGAYGFDMFKPEADDVAAESSRLLEPTAGEGDTGTI
jgi:hypothetical protein